MNTMVGNFAIVCIAYVALPGLVLLSGHLITSYKCALISD